MRPSRFYWGGFPRCRGKGGIAGDFSGLGIGVVYACLVFLELELLVGWSYEVKLDEELTTLSSISGLQGSLEKQTQRCSRMLRRQPEIGGC